MKKVYKYKIIDGHHISLPFGSIILKCGVQENDIYMWALVNPEAQLLQRQFFIHGTGHEITDTSLRYVDTVFQSVYVWHIFEKFN